MEPDPQIVTMVLGALHPQDIAAIEVYPTSDDTPIEFGGHVIFKNGSEPPCGAVVIWTKRGWPDP
jgi:hypothetical protein